MVAVLAFSVTLLIAVLLSGLARRSVLSTSAIFLVAGLVLGTEAVGVLDLASDDDTVQQLAALALFAVLFTDGMRVTFSELRSSWQLPARALGIGLPITLIATAVVARTLLGFSWGESLLLGAVLCPTDPVLAAAIVGREEIPARLRRLLNVESGLNDGFALPAVLAFLSLSAGQKTDIRAPLLEAFLGVILGVALTWTIVHLARSRFFDAVQIYEPLLGFSIGMLVFSLCDVLHLNAFLAAFSAGITLANVDPKVRAAFHELGDVAAELLKLAGLFTFGALLAQSLLENLELVDLLFTALALLAVRPLGLGISLIGTELTWHERIVAVWFGPKGFASAFFGFLVLHSALPNAGRMFQIIAVVVTASVLAHSSTDVLIARWYYKRQFNAAASEQQT